jgi:uncharacterized protein (TIGR00299 family) protein
MSDKHIHLQPLGGIAGDMFVAAMLDAFPHCRERVFADVSAVLPPAVGVARLTRVSKNGIAALHFSLDGASLLEPDTQSCLAPEAGGTPGGQAVGRPAQDRPHVDAPSEVPDVPAHYRRLHGNVPVNDYRGIRRLIESAGLSASTALHALAILEILARAESMIHGVALEDVHFHELAAWDSLMDVVAAGSVVSALGEATWSISALPLGSGQVRTQHGLLPVPAPATIRILEGYSWYSDNVPGERVTPTGAAIVRHLVPPERLSARPEGVLSAEGYGAGTRSFPEMANVLRVMVFDQAPDASGDGKAVVALQFDIDDMSGEEIGVAAERLRREEGVLDLLLSAAQGKKCRPVTVFHLLIDQRYLDECSRLVFEETSTIGLRWSVLNRIVLPRQSRQVEGGLRVKEVRRPRGNVTAKIESDELAPLAGLALRRQTKARAEGSS